MSSKLASRYPSKSIKNRSKNDLQKRAPGRAGKVRTSQAESLKNGNPPEHVNGKRVCFGSTLKHVFDIFAQVCMSVHISMQICIRVEVCMCIWYKHAHICTSTYKHSYINTRSHMHTLTRCMAVQLKSAVFGKLTCRYEIMQVYIYMYTNNCVYACYKHFMCMFM